MLPMFKLCKVLLLYLKRLKLYPHKKKVELINILHMGEPSNLLNWEESVHNLFTPLQVQMLRDDNTPLVNLLQITFIK